VKHANYYSEMLILNKSNGLRTTLPKRFLNLNDFSVYKLHRKVLRFMITNMIRRSRLNNGPSKRPDIINMGIRFNTHINGIMQSGIQNESMDNIQKMSQKTLLYTGIHNIRIAVNNLYYYMR